MVKSNEENDAGAKRKALEERRLKLETEMNIEKVEAERIYEGYIKDVRKAEAKAVEQQKIVQVKASEEEKLRQSNPFLRGLRKVGLGIAGVAAGVLGVVLAPIWVPPLAVYALVKGNQSDKDTEKSSD